MFRNISRHGWKFLLSGNGISVRTGKQFGLAAVLGVFVGLVTVVFYTMITFDPVEISNNLKKNGGAART